MYFARKNFFQKYQELNKETKRKFTSKQIQLLFQKDVEINKGLWEIAERIALIKMTLMNHQLIAA